MRTLSFPLSLALALLFPVSAFAESFTTERTIVLSRSFAEPDFAFMALDAHALNDPATAYRIVQGDGTAVAFLRNDDEVELFPEAHIDAAPPAADTVPPTRVSALQRGGDFQPVTQENYVFRFHFDHPVTATQFHIDGDSATIDRITVRLGNAANQLKDAFVGNPGGRSVTLSGEQGRYFEVSIHVRSGVLRIKNFSLRAPRTTLLWRAQPKESYTLLYGNSAHLLGPRDKTLEWNPSIPATLGSVRAIPASKVDDHDGVPSTSDNCPTTWNPEQDDGDHDAAGDACDNCLSLSNPDQEDKDRNGRGDVCDDDDRDGVANATDNCPQAQNHSQRDQDADGHGDSCDASDDRWTERRPWILGASIVGIVLLLAGAAYAVLKRTRPE